MCLQEINHKLSNSHQTAFYTILKKEIEKFQTFSCVTELEGNSRKKAELGRSGKMIQKRIVEIFIFILYWIVLAPLIVWYCIQWGWIKWDETQVFTSIKYICSIVLGLAACYLIVYIIVVLIYLKLKTWSMKIWVTQNPATANMINQERQYYDTNEPQMVEFKEMNTTATLEAEDEVCRGFNQPVPFVPEPTPRNIRKQKKPPPPPYEEINNQV